MAADGPAQASFKRFAQDDAQYFVQCRLREDPDNFEASALDLTVSSLRQCWRSEDLRRPNSRHIDALERIHTALTAAQDGPDADGAEYHVRFTPKGATLQVKCQWRETSSSPLLTHTPLVLPEAADTNSAAASVFDALLRKCDALEASSREASAACAQLQDRCTKLQAQIDRFVQNRGARDAEMTAKFVAALNEQKAMVRSLQAQLNSGRAAGSAAASEAQTAVGGDPGPSSSAAGPGGGPRATGARGRGAPADDEEYMTTGSEPSGESSDDAELDAG